MKPGDLVRLLPDEDDEPDRYDGLVGLILWEEFVELNLEVRFFRLMVNGRPYWRMPEDRLEVIGEGDPTAGKSDRSDVLLP
jgi:hypothetical protein